MFNWFRKKSSEDCQTVKEKRINRQLRRLTNKIKGTMGEELDKELIELMAQKVHKYINSSISYERDVGCLLISEYERAIMDTYSSDYIPNYKFKGERGLFNTDEKDVLSYGYSTGFFIGDDSYISQKISYIEQQSVTLMYVILMKLSRGKNVPTICLQKVLINNEDKQKLKNSLKGEVIETEDRDFVYDLLRTYYKRIDQEYRREEGDDK